MIAEREKCDLIDILIVDDNPGDVRLAQEAFKDSKLVKNMYVAEDGVDAMAFLRNEGKYSDAVRPDLVLLDLNMPRMNGRDVLNEIKSDESLKQIPVAVLTVSRSENDIVEMYTKEADCFITKPIDFNQFIDVVKSIEDFWYTMESIKQSRVNALSESDDRRNSAFYYFALI